MNILPEALSATAFFFAAGNPSSSSSTSLTPLLFDDLLLGAERFLVDFMANISSSPESSSEGRIASVGFPRESLAISTSVAGVSDGLGNVGDLVN